MKVYNRRKSLEEMIERTKTMDEHLHETVAKLELKLKYPQALIYEAEVELLAVKRSLAASRNITKYAMEELASLPHEEDGAEDEAVVPEQAQLVTSTVGRNNLSDEERERRRQRMKDLWANGRMRKQARKSRKMQSHER